MLQYKKKSLVKLSTPIRISTIACGKHYLILLTTYSSSCNCINIILSGHAANPANPSAFDACRRCPRFHKQKSGLSNSSLATNEVSPANSTHTLAHAHTRTRTHTHTHTHTHTRTIYAHLRNEMYIYRNMAQMHLRPKRGVAASQDVQLLGGHLRGDDANCMTTHREARRRRKLLSLIHI